PDLGPTGQPAHDKEIERTEEAPHIEKMSDKTLESIFEQAGGKPVKTQKEEVKRAQGEFKAGIDGLPDDNAKRARLLGLLLPLARTGGEREELRYRLADKPVVGRPA